MNQISGVRRYFEQEAGSFDSIYADEKSSFWRFLDRCFRSDIYERFRLAIEACGDFKDKSVLDIGCGSGRYAVEYALRGAREIHGIDLSEDMIRLAEDFAATAGFSARCRFERIDFFECDFDRTYELTVAMGVLDYVADPVAFLNRMLDLTVEVGVVSFPSSSVLRGQLRKYRYERRNCPLYLYDRWRIERVIERGPIERCADYSVHKIPGWGYDFVVTFVK